MGAQRIALPPIPAPENRSDTVSMVFIGDVMMHSRQLQYDSGEFLRELAPLLSGADVAVANAEFTMAGKPFSGYPSFSAPDRYARDIMDAGVDVLLLANNHIGDKGAAGLRRTLAVMPAPYAGAGADSASFACANPLMVTCKGMRIALVNFTEILNCGISSPWPRVSRMEKDEVLSQFRRARERGADFIVALPHWGTEYELLHNAAQEAWASFLAESGAAAIVGAHPHVVQDTACVSGVPVIYSLGNAVSNMSAVNTRLELAVEIRFVMERITGKRETLPAVLHFLWCTLPGKLKDNYCTVEVDKYLSSRDLWKDPSDWDNMVQTLERVKSKTGIE